MFCRSFPRKAGTQGQLLQGFNLLHWVPAPVLAKAGMRGDDSSLVCANLQQNKSEVVLFVATAAVIAAEVATKVAVIVEHGVERNGRARGSLQVSEVFEAAAGARSEFLRAGQVLAAVSQGFGFLLQQAEFLKMVRRQAYEVALPGHCDLQGLPNPPGGIRR